VIYRGRNGDNEYQEGNVSLKRMNMNDRPEKRVPEGFHQIWEATLAMKFDMASDQLTGSLLKTLVASKPGGNFLELGTGTGLATVWMISGMDNRSSLLSIENKELYLDVARKNISDNRVELLLADAGAWISSYSGKKFDLVFADAMPGKYELFEETIGLLNSHGYYLVDDMLPQPNWPEGHDKKVEDFIKQVSRRDDLVITKLDWSTGIMIIVKK
jgi:predicted O-methyltransferase YrrM